MLIQTLEFCQLMRIRCRIHWFAWKVVKNTKWLSLRRSRSQVGWGLVGYCIAEKGYLCDLSWEAK